MVYIRYAIVDTCPLRQLSGAIDMKMIVQLSVAAIALMAATSASADPVVFAVSNNAGWSLTINGQNFASVDTGWIRSDGQHTAAISNFLVGTSGGFNYNNFAVFDLSGFAGTVTSASMTINSFTVRGASTFTLNDVSASYAALDATRPAGDVTGQALFADLGSGLAFGSRGYVDADTNMVRTITLNEAGLSAIQAATSGQLQIGGTLNFSPSAAVPEPAGWAMMISGFGLVGGALRRRSKPGASITVA